jgi:hypothetical protein
MEIGANDYFCLPVQGLSSFAWRAPASTCRSRGFKAEVFQSRSLITSKKEERTMVDYDLKGNMRYLFVFLIKSFISLLKKQSHINTRAASIKG